MEFDLDFDSPLPVPKPVVDFVPPKPVSKDDDYMAPGGKHDQWLASGMPF